MMSSFIRYNWFVWLAARGFVTILSFFFILNCDLLCM